MVPSFFISTPIPLFLAILGTANGMVPPPNQMHSSNWQPIPILHQHIQRDFRMKGVLSQMLRKCFSQKMKTFSPLGNVSIGKRGKSIQSFVRQNYF